MSGQDNTASRGTLADPLATPDFAMPDFFPMRIDEERNTILFVQMSRDCFRQSVFLDGRAILAGKARLSTDIANLKALRPQRPIHVILHAAFCGSTLLARYLERLPRCLVLKEPAVLFQLSRMPEDAPAAVDADDWYDRFRVTLTLLARAYPTDDAVVVKAPDRCNWMAGRLLDHDPRTRIIFLSAPLRVFLLQALKDEERRAFVRTRLQQLGRSMMSVPFLSAMSTADLTDGQSAAALWLLNSALCGSLLARPDAHRVLVVNGEDLISRPKETTLAAAEFLGLVDDAESRAALEALRPALQHAKHGDLPYDAVARAADFADAESRWGDEVEAALSWAATVSSEWLDECPFPLT